MKLTLEFFGPLQDRMGGPSARIELDNAPQTLPELLKLLTGKLDDVAPLQDPHIRMAINDTLCQQAETLSLADGDRIAFLSPFSGG
jgi:molybdopterin converting factor small subunit